MEEISKGKQEWLKEVGAIDITKFNYMIPSNGNLFSIEYLKNKTLEQIKAEYELLYP